MDAAGAATHAALAAELQSRTDPVSRWAVRVIAAQDALIRQQDAQLREHSERLATVRSILESHKHLFQD